VASPRFQVAPAWVLRDPMVIAIPKAADLAHVEATLAGLTRLKL
jgi:diketogulonate reductase-like aldo/keto reductase